LIVEALESIFEALESIFEVGFSFFSVLGLAEKWSILPEESWLGLRLDPRRPDPRLVAAPIGLERRDQTTGQARSDDRPQSKSTRTDDRPILDNRPRSMRNRRPAEIRRPSTIHEKPTIGQARSGETQAWVCRFEIQGHFGILIILVCCFVLILIVCT
jgi:hypothetical protein